MIGARDGGGKAVKVDARSVVVADGCGGTPRAVARGSANAARSLGALGLRFTVGLHVSFRLRIARRAFAVGVVAGALGAVLALRTIVPVEALRLPVALRLRLALRAIVP